MLMLIVRWWCLCLPSSRRRGPRGTLRCFARTCTSWLGRSSRERGRRAFVIFAVSRHSTVLFVHVLGRRVYVRHIVTTLSLFLRLMPCCMMFSSSFHPSLPSPLTPFRAVPSSTRSTSRRGSSHQSVDCIRWRQTRCRS